jgi:D-beta-D-heptose 7-phosphate kinase / D-beta-D-heptose 1-phosphate adenosyltransferase
MSDIGSLSSLLGQLNSSHVVCVGDVMLDRFVEGDVKRISPEAPIPVFSVRRETEMLGGAGNVARNIAAFGGQAALVSVVGDDAAGLRLCDLIADTSGITPTIIKDPARPTTIKTRYVAAGQQLLRADRETVEPLPKQTAKAVASAVAEALSAENSVLVLSDYGKGVLDDALIRSLIEIGEKAKAMIFVDPKGRDYARYKGAGVLTPNRQELAQASGMPTDTEDEVTVACRHIIETAGVDAVLATRSEQGMSLITVDHADHLPARAREVFDVSGAGDTVVAAIATVFGTGAPLSAGAAFANIAAGVVVGKIGTATVYPSEILSALHETEMLGADTKIQTPDQAADRIATWRRQEFRCGFTNGCFDLLHPGHISLLTQAKAACDRLIIGLNSDASVRRLKGPDRPIQNESSRAQVLASLEMVDMVMIFDEETPLTLIETLRPDVLIKGADYTVDEVVGAAAVQSWGGEVMLAEILDGHSTTSTIEKMGAES